jgi:competence protein ComFC
MWLRETGDGILDFLFPPYCVACRRHGAWFCPDCQAQIEFIYPPICRRCGSPLAESAPLRASPPPPGQTAGQTCRRCRKAPPRLSGLLACAYYTAPLRQAIRQFKYNDLCSLAAPLGQLMVGGWQRLAPGNCGIDVIVPVPLHVSRERQRGYNQSALLARELGAHMQLPVVEKVLVRTKATAPQVDLGIEERKANVKDAFQCVKDSLSGKRVLLVDDVYTTGSTLDAAYSALHQGGVSYIWAFTLARAR